MPWKKMTPSASLKRLKAELLFELGYGPRKVSRVLAVNYSTLRDWQESWKSKREGCDEENTFVNRTLAETLFGCGYGYRAVSRMLRLKSVWFARDCARRYRRLSRVQARKERGEL